MSIDYKAELAKEEYVNLINEINAKYDLPLTIVAILLDGILLEVRKMRDFKVQEEKKITEVKVNEENSI